MPKSDSAKAREHRLAAKLRENLKRRKAAPVVRKTDEAASGTLPGSTQKDGGKD